MSKVKRNSKQSKKSRRRLSHQHFASEEENNEEYSSHDSFVRELKPKASRLPTKETEPTSSPTMRPTYLDYKTKCVDPNKGIDLEKYTVEYCGPCLE